MHKWLALPLLCLAAHAVAQDVPRGVPPPASEAETALAFGTNDTRMTVPVSIAGAGPYPFVVDTGAERTVISRQLARTLGLAAGRTTRLTAMSGTSMVGTVLIPSLSVSPLRAQRIEAPALENYHLGAPGLLGIDTLQGHAVTIDFDARTMTVAASRKRPAQPASDRDEIVVLAKSLFGQLVVTDAFCGSQRVRLILDTGTAVSIGNEALRRKVTRKGAVMRPIDLLGVTGGTIVADYTFVPRITIGSLTIQEMPVAFADAAPFKHLGLDDKPAILLGMDALRLFRRVDIDFANRQVRLALPKDVARS